MPVALCHAPPVSFFTVLGVVVLFSLNDDGCPRMCGTRTYRLHLRVCTTSVSVWDLVFLVFLLQES